MPQLSETIQGQIAFEFGYGGDLSQIENYLTKNFTDFTITKIEEICDRLTVIEATRVASVGDTMATKVGTIELSYGQHWKMLFFEGATLVDQLAEIIFGIQQVTPQYYTNRYVSILDSSCGCAVKSYESII
jgi:hypothetical protein